MKPSISLVALLLAVSSSWAASPRLIPVSDQVRSDVRAAVESHRASEKDEIRRADAAAGRHLTAAERAQLREQVRQQWKPRPQPIRATPADTVLRGVSVPAPDNGRSPAPTARPAAQHP